MQGTMTTIKTNGTIETVELDAAPKLDALQTAVGGYIETVPMFETYNGEGAVAFCNEEGKLTGLPYNDKATKLWAYAIGYAGGTQLIDALYGDVVVLTGDEGFMGAI